MIPKAVLELRQFHTLGADGIHHLFELLLAGHDDPDRRDGLPLLDAVFALLAKLLHHGAQIFDFGGALSHILANLINDERQRLAWLTQCHRLESPGDDPAYGDVRLAPDSGLLPGIGVRVGGGVHAMQDRAGAVGALRSLTDHPPGALVVLLAAPHELFELALFL